MCMYVCVPHCLFVMTHVSFTCQSKQVEGYSLTSSVKTYVLKFDKLEVPGLPTIKYKTLDKLFNFTKLNKI